MIQLAMMPAYMRFFGDYAILGVWLTIINLLSIILALDVGIGNGLRNKLTYSLTKGDFDNAKKYVTSAYTSMGVLTIIFIIVCFFLIRLLDWNAIFGIDDSIIASGLLVEVVNIIIYGIIIKLFLSLISGIIFALQLSMINNIIAFMQNFLVLIFLLAAKPSEVANDLRTLSWVNTLSMNIPLVIATVVIFTTKLKNIRPNLRYLGTKHIKSTLGLGLGFFTVQTLWIFVNHNDIFITQYFSSANVVDFQVYMRLFGFIGTFFTLLMTPIWSAITKAMAQDNYKWIMKMFKLNILLLIISSGLVLLTVPFLGVFLNVWLGNNAPAVVPEYAVIVAALGIFTIWNAIMGTMAFGMSILKPYVVTLGIAAVLKIPLTYILQIIVGNWSAVILTSVLLILPNIITVPLFVYKRIKQNIPIGNTIKECYE